MKTRQLGQPQPEGAAVERGGAVVGNEEREPRKEKDED